ncbi:GD13887 [Drosophila simulans]|uniref:GD13887 n=1 Tax=Drosophila simulans TaxID=7240 RepID=B4QRK3_DROSI|nr:GD13887 [Drosophila simulans]
MIWVPNQLVGAPSGTDVTIDCHTEAHPKAIIYWVYNSVMVLPSKKYKTDYTENSYRAHMKLTIRNLQYGDFGNYRCISKNSLGETEGSIRVYDPESTRPYEYMCTIRCPPERKTKRVVASGWWVLSGSICPMSSTPSPASSCPVATRRHIHHKQIPLPSTPSKQVTHTTVESRENNIIPSSRNDTTKSLQTDVGYAMKNDLYPGSASSSSSGGSSSAASSSSSMQTSALPGGVAGNSLSSMGSKGSLAIGKSTFYTERPPNEYAASSVAGLLLHRALLFGSGIYLTLL